MSDAIVKITDRARAILAFSEEPDRVEADIRKENKRHQHEMEVLFQKQQALQKAIFQYGSN